MAPAITTTGPWIVVQTVHCRVWNEQTIVVQTVHCRVWNEQTREYHRGENGNVRVYLERGPANRRAEIKNRKEQENEDE